jgi:hypothetical protein
MEKQYKIMNVKDFDLMTYIGQDLIVDGLKDSLPHPHFSNRWLYQVHISQIKIKN